ncbi:DDRGK domain-containing protein 1 [Anabrus simplex]|uniref:DDRGK domain-containing protein 1 n=1 Tax=Anabrus simplex TaxID=316456 RepID=UPI0034DCF615
MDIILLISVASGLIVLLCVLVVFKQRSSKEKPATRVPAPGRGNDGARPRRAVGARHARPRTRFTAQHYNESDDADDDDDENEPKGIEFSEKLGAKKRAKLEAKAEKKAHREAEMREREEKKKRKEVEEEERLKSEERSKLEREKELEEERKALEEKERKEQEEYMKMKEMFSVEEEGFDEGGNSDSEENLLQEFVSYIKNMKVVVLEDLAATFKLKTQNVIDRIQDLQKDGILTGVIDDRGKFIYISQEELTAVSKFVKQRGRVSIAELAESSNQLINLNPVQSVEVKS